MENCDVSHALLSALKAMILKHRLVCLRIMWGFVPVLPVGLELVVPPLIITFELAFLITLLTVVNVVELLVALIDLGVLHENVPLITFSTEAGNRRRYLGCAKGGNGETGDWKQQTPVVTFWRTTLSVQRGQDFATMRFNPWRQLFTTHCVW